jgi:DNA-binding response OmpR family regulator
MRNPNAVVSKDDILRNVWDHAFDGDPNIVEVYVSRIRAAIGASTASADSSSAVLDTVRGVGYRLSERVAP